MNEHPEHAGIQLATELRTTGATYADIADRLTDAGYRTARGKAWTKGTIRKRLVDRVGVWPVARIPAKEIGAIHAYAYRKGYVNPTRFINALFGALAKSGRGEADVRILVDGVPLAPEDTEER